MADENSIYNITEHDAAVTYDKDSIVASFERFTPSNIPKSVKYYYSTSNNNLNNTPSPDSSIWGGVTKVEGKNKPKFIWKPSYNLSVNHTPRTINISFGNGYEQRFQDGIFNDLIKINLKFEHRDIKEAKAINHFLKSRKGVESFVFENIQEPHNDLTAGGHVKLFICKAWDSEFVFYNNYTITAQFEQVSV
jgi:phage-related protein